MNPTSRYTIGLRYALLTGIVYIILLFLRYHFFNVSPVSFGLVVLISYVIILMMYLFTGIARKKELGGFGELREIFQSIFIVILITELVYVVFNFIYLKYIDPAFWEKLRATSLAFFQKHGSTQEQIEQNMKSFKDADNMVKPMGLLKGYGFSVIIDSIFGFVFASILRKKKPVYDEILPDSK